MAKKKTSKPRRDNYLIWLLVGPLRVRRRRPARAV